MSESVPLAWRIRDLAGRQPDAPAYHSADVTLSWSQYVARAQALASALIERGLVPGDRIAVLLPDGVAVHIAFLAIEWMGGVIVGLGARSGRRETEHLLKLAGAKALVSAADLPGGKAVELFEALREAGVDLLREHLLVEPESGLLAGSQNPDARESPALEPYALDVEAPFLLNSTSGTTGMPKCVIHDQRRWFAFHEFAVEAGALSARDVLMSVVPAPFGFGIWTAHVTPALLGVPTVLQSRFDATRALRAIERHGVTVLAAVSTQFIMMLECESDKTTDFSSLRVLFTGGEAVPRERAEAFEERTGARVLQFYGSNEVGAVSRTTLDDPAELRLTTAGRVIDEMHVRLFDEQGNDVTTTGRGQPGCRGPTLSQGYYGDAAANAQLVREDGWMMLGDIVTIDAQGYLRVVGRTDDFIIRGGKNISALAVEERVATHPAVAHVGVVAAPDPVFGERACACVELRPSATLDLETLCLGLRAQGVSKELLPEHLIVFDTLPRNAGGKLAKGELRALVRSRFEGGD